LEEIEAASTVIEDLILQAEIFRQYSMRSKAVERLERIQKLFPHEEERNDQLRQLYVSAGVLPQYAEKPSRPAPLATKSSKEPAAAPAPTPSPQRAQESVENFTRITEITRNIYRQSNV